jgi:hypothetical protein
MDKKRLGLWAPILVLAAALAMLAVSTGEVDAAPGKGKGGGKPGGGSTATLTVTPNQVPLGATSINISGSGLGSNQGLQVGVQGGIPTYYVVTDGNGSFSLTYTPGSGSFDTASPYGAFAAKFKGHDLVTLATATFTVCSTNPC